MISMYDRIHKANEVHNNFYDYSDIDIITKSQDLVPIICPKHGKFIQRWNDHIQGCGCSMCGKIKKQNKLKKSVTYYKQQCAKIHNNKYDYTLWDQDTSRHTLVLIVCPIHGKYTQSLNSHIMGRGCKKCANSTSGKKRQKGLSYYIKSITKIHNNKYDYSLLPNDIKTTDIVQIICPTHGIFKQRFNSHIMGRGCNKCAPSAFKQTCILKYNVPHIKQKNIPPNILELINDKTWLIEQHITKKKALSTIANELMLSPSTIGLRMKQLNIPVHNYFRSEAEQDISNTLRQIDPTLKILHNVRTIISQELDIYLPEYKIAIEYNGLYWHSEIHKHANYHLDKTKQCEEKGIRLIHIFEDEWSEQKQKCVDTLTHVLKKSNTGTFARNTNIREINWKEARNFLNKYHLLNAGQSGNYRIGAYDKNEQLIGVMVFGQQNNENSNTSIVELRRFVTNKKNNPGLGSKMFKYAVNQQNYQCVIAFVDRRWFTGLVKDYIGFKKIGETLPAIWWTNGNTTTRYHRRFITKKQLLQQYPEFTNDMTKLEMLLKLGFYRIYDCGKLKLEWRR